MSPSGKKMSPDYSHIVGNSNKLLDQASTLLKEKLKKAPKDEALLWRLGEILRQRGHLSDALEQYQKLLSINPDHNNTALINSILQQKNVDLSISTEGLQPTPFFLIKRLLNEKQQQTIWKKIRNYQDIFLPSKLASELVDLRHRRSHVLYQKQIREISPWFMEIVIRSFSQLQEKFLFSNLLNGKKEIQLTMHLDGGFYNIHKDSSDHGKNKTRKVTFVYYFYRTPRRFRGGDLILYDTDCSKNQHSCKYTRISPDNNSIIFFPSQFYHQVTPVSCKNDNIEHGRFTINGWLHEDSLLSENDSSNSCK